MTGDKLALIAGICIFSAALCRMFDSGSREYAVFIKTAAAVGVTAAVISALVPVLDRIEKLYGYTGAHASYLTVMLKALGICYLTQLASDICRDSGESSLACAAETAGKAALLVLSLPLFERAAELAAELIY